MLIIVLREDFMNMLRKYQNIITFALLIILSLGITFITFIFAGPLFDIEMPLFQSYFKSPILILMNFIPIFIFMLIIYILSNRLWIGFLITWVVFLALSLVNKFKLIYRDDPFVFMDIVLLRESLEMAERYTIDLSANIIALIAGLLIITFIITTYFDYRISDKKIRFISLLTSLFMAIIIFSGPYFNQELYEEIGDKTLINIWNQSKQFQSKGFVYPFMYSIKDVAENKPEGYDEKQAINDLSQHEYSDIAEDKKVNIIAVMLEAYSDFSEFESIEIGKDPYKFFHSLQEESIQGRLVTNVFAANTIVTERSFITGYYNHPRYFKNTNSFVWYFKEQGYITEAMHPIYGWFYNRRNVNEYLGFDRYLYYENKFSLEQEEFLEDYDFFDYIIQGYEEAVKNNKYYFNFSLTYQNHGPYSDEKISDEEYIAWKEHYDMSLYNIANNYLSGIAKTDKAIEKLINYFRDVNEPTVIILFGDHKPWLGENAAGYKSLGIDIDISTVEGYLNFYTTPYIMWGNDSAKALIGDSFVGRGRDISPNFLMTELFNYLGWEGNELVSYQREFMKHIDVLHHVYFKENGVFIEKLSTDNLKRYNNYKNVEYYISKNSTKITCNMITPYGILLEIKGIL